MLIIIDIKSHLSIDGIFAARMCEWVVWFSLFDRYELFYSKAFTQLRHYSPLIAMPRPLLCSVGGVAAIAIANNILWEWKRLWSNTISLEHRVKLLIMRFIAVCVCLCVCVRVHMVWSKELGKIPRILHQFGRFTQVNEFQLNSMLGSECNLICKYQLPHTFVMICSCSHPASSSSHIFQHPSQFCMKTATFFQRSKFRRMHNTNKQIKSFPLIALDAHRPFA